MELKGLTINILGDSITEGVGVSDRETKKYTSVFERKSGAKVNTYGIGGTRIARQHKPSQKPRHDLVFLDRVEGMDENADIIVVFGGTNDFGHGDAAFGCFDDRDEYTFYGAMHSLILRIKRRFPNAEIVFMTPLHRAAEERVRGEETLYLSKYVEIIKEVAAYYSLPVLDLWSVSGIQPKVDIIKQKYCPDGLHPNDAGHILMAERIGNFLAAL